MSVAVRPVRDFLIRKYVSQRVETSRKSARRGLNSSSRVLATLKEGDLSQRLSKMIELPVIHRRTSLRLSLEVGRSYIHEGIESYLDHVIQTSQVESYLPLRVVLLSGSENGVTMSHIESYRVIPLSGSENEKGKKKGREVFVSNEGVNRDSGGGFLSRPQLNTYQLQGLLCSAA
jgi:hypothetical protein